MCEFVLNQNCIWIYLYNGCKIECEGKRELSWLTDFATRWMVWQTPTCELKKEGKSQAWAQGPAIELGRGGGSCKGHWEGAASEVEGKLKKVLFPVSCVQQAFREGGSRHQCQVLLRGEVTWRLQTDHWVWKLTTGFGKIFSSLRKTSSSRIGEPKSEQCGWRENVMWATILRNFERKGSRKMGW